MPEVRDQLINLYAGKAPDDAISSAQYQNLLIAHEKNDQFKLERDQVERAQSRLQHLFKDKLNVERVGIALKELKQQRIAAKEALYLALIEKGYKPHWKAEQQKYFDDGYKLISFTYQYFLSFTSRYPPPPGANPVNERYKYFIREVLTATRAAKIPETENRLARAVHEHLSVGRSGFCYPDYQHDNSETVKKLKDGLASSIFLIQLVQNIMFEAPVGTTNFSFFEYDFATTALPQKPRFLFLVAESDRTKLVKEFNVSGDYSQWYAHVIEKDPPYLASVDQVDKKQGKLLKDLLDAKIIKHLDDFWENLFRNVPP